MVPLSNLKLICSNPIGLARSQKITCYVNTMSWQIQNIFKLENQLRDEKNMYEAGNIHIIPYRFLEIIVHFKIMLQW